MKLRFTPSAETELLLIAKYIRNENPEAALNFLKKADELLHRLEIHPLSGRTIPEYPGLPYRELLVLPYRFFYSIDNQTTWIVAVWHTSQLPKDPNIKGRLTTAEADGSHGEVPECPQLRLSVRPTFIRLRSKK